jgi:hypothetical protein
MSISQNLLTKYFYSQWCINALPQLPYYIPILNRIIQMTQDSEIGNPLDNRNWSNTTNRAGRYGGQDYQGGGLGLLRASASSG